PPRSTCVPYPPLFRSEVETRVVPLEQEVELPEEIATGHLVDVVGRPRSAQSRARPPRGLGVRLGTGGRVIAVLALAARASEGHADRKSTRLNSSHVKT